MPAVATYIIIAVVAAIVGIVIGLPIGVAYRKKIAEAQIGSAELQAKKIIIAVEKNKPACIRAMRSIAGGDDTVSVKVLPSMYPQGAEKVLIYHTTGKVVPEGGLPIDVGVIVLNCTTLAEIARYIRTGMPLVEKCVTVDGSAVVSPRNLIAPIGATLEAVFNFCGGFKAQPGKVLYGGPMMGVSVPELSMPVLKQTNALLALDAKDAAPADATNCIRCGRCTIMPNSLQ